MGYVKKRETCSRKHDEKKVGHMKVQVFKRKKESWTLEGPSIQKERERQRQPMSKEKGINERDGS